MFKVLMSSVALSSLLMISTATYAQMQEQEPLAEQQSLAKQSVQHKLAKMQSLSAQFQQTVTADNGDQLQQLTGELAIQRPDKLRWQTDPPDDTLMVASGDTVWYYNPFVEQVTVYQQQDIASNSPMLLLLTGSEQQWHNYQVSKPEQNVYRIEQLDGDSSLRLTFNDDVLQQIRLSQQQGDTIELNLQQVTVNPSLADSSFRFEIPDGVDVDDQR